MSLNTAVKLNDSTLSGVVIASFIDQSGLHYIVALNEGFWSEDHMTYISTLVVHSDNLFAYAV